MIFSARISLLQSCWRSWISRAKRYHQASSILHNLPPELLLDILDRLRPDDVASLALCDKALSRFIGPSAWTTLKLGNGNDEARRSFLRTLTRDDGRYFLCHECVCLHDRRRVQIPAACYGPNFPLLCIRGSSGPNECYDCFLTHDGGYRYSLWFPHVQLAMARHSFGPDHGFDLAVLAGTEIACIPPVDLTTLLSVDPGIIDGEFCMRVQQWFCFSSGNYACLFKHRRWKVCSHIVYYFMPELVECKLRHADQQQACQTCYPLLSCTLCNVEFSLNFRALEDGQTTALVVSKWINFGSGETRADPKWRLKTRQIGADLRIPAAKADEVNGLCTRFEREHSTSITDQTKANASLLHGKLYQKSFKPVGYNRIWAWHGPLPSKLSHSLKI
nr:hypothetical protein CFP56_11339 [Quercus suber]